MTRYMILTWTRQQRLGSGGKKTEKKMIGDESADKEIKFLLWRASPGPAGHTGLAGKWTGGN
jgi:hypothetical protein